MLTRIYLMQIGICIISNTAKCDKFDSLFKDDDRLHGKFDLSTATQNPKLKDENSLPEIMKITTLDMPPYSSFYKLNGKIIGNVTSDAFYIFDLISKKLNITYEIVMPDREILGDLRNGVISMLHEGKVDMAVAFLPMNPDLHPYVSYSPVLKQIELKAMMKRQKYSEIRIDFLSPFTAYNKILIVTAVIISGLIFFVTIYLRSCLWKHSKTDNYTFLQCAWFIYGAILKQGSTMAPKTDSIRVLFGSWWIFTIIFSSFYAANLFAVLNIPELIFPYHSLTSTVKNNPNWLSTREHYVDYAIKQSKTEEFGILKTLFTKDNRIHFINKSSTDKEILNLVYRKSKIYLGDSNHLKRMIVNDYLEDVRKNKLQKKRCKYVIVPETIYKQPVAFAYPKSSKYQKKIDKQILPQTERCEYVIMPETIYKQPVAFAYPKNSLHRKKFDKQLRNLVEAGIFKYLERRKLPAMDYCPLNLNVDNHRLNMTDLSLSFKILAGGLTLATLSFILENIVFHLQRIYKNCRNNRKPALTKNHTQILPFVHRVNNYFDDHPSTSSQSPTHQSVSMDERIIYNGREYLEIEDLEAND